MTRDQRMTRPCVAKAESYGSHGRQTVESSGRGIFAPLQVQLP
jgi:hypothetical protein